MHDRSDRLALAINRLTPRERWLSAMAILALLGFGAFEAFGWADGQRERYELAQADLALAHQARADRLRDTPDAFDVAQLHALSTWSQHGRNLWLVRLKVEQQIVEAASGAGLADAKVKLAEAPEGDSAAPLLRAEVTGSYRGGGLVGLLKRLSDNQTTYILDRLEVSRADAPQFKIELLFPVQVAAPTGRP
ncbi:MAG TPA: hypothetical protein VIJ94_10160 [Caulobacteraceae bacterium]